MRRRLTATFVLLTLVLLSIFVTVRLGVAHVVIRELEVTRLQLDAVSVARSVDEWVREGRPVRAEVIGAQLSPGQHAELDIAGRRLLVTGPDQDPDEDYARDLGASASSGEVKVTLHQSDAVMQAVWRRVAASMVALAGLLAVLAGVVGYLAAGALSRPFDRLAVAAAALGRGRFDLDLPSSRLPEVRALSASLQTSASGLQRRVARDQEFLLEASHRLRTPMTGMRLELEGLQLREDLDPEVRTTLDRSIASLDRLQELTTEVFATARAGRAAADDDLQVTLEQLAQQTAQAWGQALNHRNLQVSASVDGDLDQRLVPGPVEQVLDQVLADVSKSAKGPVRLSFAGAGDQLAIDVRATPRSEAARAERAGLVPVREMVETLAGRCAGDPIDGGIRIWLPRR